MSQDTAEFSEKAQESRVDRTYEQVKLMAASYELRPGERINESTLSKKLDVSRTPLREALNRLVVEGFLEGRPGQGFFRRDLDVKEVLDLYRLRTAVECAGVRLAAQQANTKDIDALTGALESMGGDEGDQEQAALVGLDEHFHESLLRLSGNVEMVKVLENINARTSFVRWIQTEQSGRASTRSEHLKIVRALKRRDADRCVAILESHIEGCLEGITAAIREGYYRIHMGHLPWARQRT